jgi:hypothetical protein
MGSIALVQLLGSAFRSIRNRVNAVGSGAWPKVEAVVTADAERQGDFTGSVIEIVYSYRFEGELYTGLHEEPVFLGDTEYLEGFIKGTRFLVRVKPDEPEVSLLLDERSSRRNESIRENL